MPHIKAAAGSESERLLDDAHRDQSRDDYGTTSPDALRDPARKAPSEAQEALLATQSGRPRGSSGSGTHSSVSDRAEADDDLESLDAAPTPTAAERRRTILRFIVLWSAVAAVTVYLIVQAFRRGGGEFDWKGALKKAAGGGVAGAMAMVVQVLTLMPLRTVMKCVFSSDPAHPTVEIRDLSRAHAYFSVGSFQYRHGKTTTEAGKTLYAEGGLPRFWAGLPAALVQGPVARFGDTASQAGIFALLASNPFLSRLPSPLKTVFASLVGALFRMVLMPIDALKTTMQTDGTRPALRILASRVKRYGPATLWAGAFATAAANFVGSWPWFATYNVLSANLPMPDEGDVWGRLARQAFIGFVASVVSDTCSNSLRVIKTYRQVHTKRVSYRASGSLPLFPESRSIGAHPRFSSRISQAKPRASSFRTKAPAACSDAGSRRATSRTACRACCSVSCGRRSPTCWTSAGAATEEAEATTTARKAVPRRRRDPSVYSRPCRYSRRILPQCVRRELLFDERALVYRISTASSCKVRSRVNEAVSVATETMSKPSSSRLRACSPLRHCQSNIDKLPGKS